MLGNAQGSTTSPPEKFRYLMFRPLLLTDCCSIYCAVLEIQPLPVDKRAKLLLHQLRDLRLFLDLSFADNTCNMRDVATKNAGSLGIMCRFTTTGRFGTPSLAGRIVRGAIYSTPFVVRIFRVFLRDFSKLLFPPHTFIFVFGSSLPLRDILVFLSVFFFFPAFIFLASSSL